MIELLFDKKNRIVFWISIFFTCLSVGLVYFDVYYLFLFPIILFASIVFLFKPDVVFYSLAFLVPLSINPNDVDLGHLSLSIPTEPMLFLLVLIFIYYLVSEKNINTKIFTHPFSILIYFYIFWLLITTITSVDVIVSIKFVIAKIWFIVPSYFLAHFYFKKEQNIISFLTLFICGISIVAAYNVIHLASFNFEDKPSQWTMQPFFKDHAILGAILAIAIPISFGLRSYFNSDVIRKNIFSIISVILIICLIFTYSRAAWVSVIPALLLFFLLKFKFRFSTLFSIVVGLIIIGLFNINAILDSLGQNKVASSDDLVENVESITNISSDASNLERINRWSCAIDMWREKPFFGWGPGTYMFNYAPFQLSANYTEISTNFGDVGNAHSEYLGPLAETGVIGLLIFLLMFIMVFYYLFKVYHVAKEKSSRIIISTAGCGLITYFVHGFMNNYLDTDKAAVIFWILISVIISFDVKNHNKTKLEISSEQL